MDTERPDDRTESENQPERGQDESEREAQAEDPTSPVRGFHDIEEAEGEE